MNDIATRAISPKRLLPALAVTFFAVHGFLGELVRTLGITRELAGLFITLVVNGQMYIISAFYPWLIPAVITVRTLLSVLGTAALVGY